MDIKQLRQLLARLDAGQVSEVEALATIRQEVLTEVVTRVAQGRDYRVTLPGSYVEPPTTLCAVYPVEICLGPLSILVVPKG